MGATCLALVLVPMKSMVNSGQLGRSCWGDHTEPSASLPGGRPGTALLKLILPKPACKKKGQEAAELPYFSDQCVSCAAHTTHT